MRIKKHVHSAHAVSHIYGTAMCAVVKKGKSRSFLIRDPEDSTSARFGCRRRINWLLLCSCGSLFSPLPPASFHVFKATPSANINSQKAPAYGRKHFVPALNLRTGLNLFVHPQRLP